MSDSTLRQVAQLSKLSFPELQERWRALFGGEPPAYHRRFLVKRLAYRIQELAYGGLPETTRTQMADILQDAGLDDQASIPGRGRTQKRPDDLPLAGTRLVREWNGRRYEVTVASGGFVFEGRRYRSLTAITKVITGTHWNGRAFWGLRSGRRKEQIRNLVKAIAGGRLVGDLTEEMNAAEARRSRVRQEIAVAEGTRVPVTLNVLPTAVRQIVSDLPRMLEAGQVEQVRSALSKLVGKIEVTGEDLPGRKRPGAVLTLRGNLEAVLQLAQEKVKRVGSPGGIRTRDLVAENHVS